jgi:predicted CoA-binding protein
MVVFMDTLRNAATDFLSTKRVAVTGVSRTRRGTAATSCTHPRRRGYDVFAVNPNAETIEGDRAYPDLKSIPGGAHAVVIGTRPEAADNTMREGAQLGINHVWMHRSVGTGSVLVSATKYGREQAIIVIDGGCPLMFDPSADIGHKCMKCLLSMSGAVPRHVG